MKAFGYLPKYENVVFRRYSAQYGWWVCFCHIRLVLNVSTVSVSPSNRSLPCGSRILFTKHSKSGNTHWVLPLGSTQGVLPRVKTTLFITTTHHDHPSQRSKVSWEHRYLVWFSDHHIWNIWSKNLCILEKETNSKQEQAVENSQSQDIHDSTSFVEVQQRYAR